LKVRVPRLLDLLIQRPSANELLKALETDLLGEYKLSNAIIFTLDSHNILITNLDLCFQALEGCNVNELLAASGFAPRSLKFQ